MLRKRTRSHQRDQHMGSDSHYHCDVSAQKHKTNSFFCVPGVFVGLSPKASDSESVRSPTSPLDFRVFSPLGNPLRSLRSSQESQQKSWGCSKVGLSIIDALGDESRSREVVRSSDSKNIIFGAQKGVKIPNVQSHFGCFEAPNSLPNNYAVFPSKQIVKPSNLSNKNSSVQFEIGESSSDDECSEKIWSFSLYNGHSGSNLGKLRTSLSSRNVCLENATSSTSLPHSFIARNLTLNSSSGTKLASIPVSVNTQNGFIGSLSASEIELSEDYTRVIKHGPNPKTTHIYGDCILECHNNELTDTSSDEIKEIASSPYDNCAAIPVTYPSNNFKEIASSPYDNCAAIPVTYPSNNFLSFCFSCKKNLEGEDIYMYRGEKAFCSADCREEEISVQEKLERKENSSSNSNELSETSMFIAT